MAGIEPTAEYVSRDAPKDEGSFEPKPGIVECGAPRLATETQALLRPRLRAATSLLLAGFLLFFVRNLLLPERIFWLAVLHALVLLFLGALLGLLWSRASLSLRGLRTIE